MRGMCQGICSHRFSKARVDVREAGEGVMTEKQILIALRKMFITGSHQTLSNQEAEEVAVWLDERLETAESLEALNEDSTADQERE